MKIFVTLAFAGILLFVAGCSPPSEADAVDVGQVEEEHLEDDDHIDEDEHMDEDENTHMPDDHMAGMHDVPQEAAAVPNPVPATDDSRADGGAGFAANCAACHGEKGRGDGPAAESLEKAPADLAAGHVQELSDGALFYIVSHGKPDTPMPAWEGVLSEEERWQVVNFLRTFGEDGIHDEHEEEADHEEGDDHQEDDHQDDDHD